MGKMNKEELFPLKVYPYTYITSSQTVSQMCVEDKKEREKKKQVHSFIWSYNMLWLWDFLLFSLFI